MKKVVSLILCAVMLAGLLSVVSFAKDTDMQFSVKGAKGKPGDTVDVEVYVDKNIGTWAMKFHVHFDSTALKLKDVKNGTVYKDSDFTKSVLTNDGYYVYYAQMDDPEENNTNTGLVLTLTFELTERAVNGYHDVWLVFPDNGVGWFFDAKDLNVDRSVPADGEVKASVTVTGSEATSELATDDKGVIADKETKEPVTAYVTDDKGELLENEKGELETYVVPSGKKEDAPQYVTDADGNFVRDSEGNYETYYEDAKGNIVDKNAETSGTASADTSKDNSTLRKVLIIAAVVCVAVAAVIIVIVITGSKKKNKEG
ncbi:MAG: cohesin domain-containing protein [Clostridia bacterium]|nr:cohesin domain-containing protein [Clostridia bacterium]